LGIDAWQPFTRHSYAVPKPKQMAGYVGSVGGDHGDLNQSSTAIQNKLGGSGNIVNITAAEIAVIVITVTLVFLALVGVFYCRVLQARRDIDMENMAKERGFTHTTGDAIELEHNKRASGSSCNTVSINNTPESGEPSSSKGKTPAVLESGQEPKPPLRHYIHWKNPYEMPKAKTKQHEDG
ncbi:hypothetical protein B0T21DRAFT_293751, partial [Apiosordaria backusii]